MNKIGLVMLLAILSVLTLVLLRQAAPTGQQVENNYAPAPVAAAGPGSSRGGNFRFSTGEVATPSSPLVVAPTSAPLTTDQAASVGIVPPTPLPVPQTDDQILQSVQAQIAKLDPSAQPRFTAFRPANRGELTQMQVTGRDDGNQVLVTVACPNCDVKALVPTAQASLTADDLLFVCERQFAGCRVVAGRNGARSQQVRAYPNTQPLPTAVARLGQPVEPPFAR